MIIYIYANLDDHMMDCLLNMVQIGMDIIHFALGHLSYIEHISIF